MENDLHTLTQHSINSGELETKEFAIVHADHADQKNIEWRVTIGGLTLEWLASWMMQSTVEMKKRNRFEEFMINLTRSMW